MKPVWKEFPEKGRFTDSQPVIPKSSHTIMEIAFHPDAAERFNDIADKFRERVRIVRKTPTGHQTSYAPHAAAKITPADVIGPITWSERIVDGLGNEVGRVWTLRGDNVGLLDDAYEGRNELSEGVGKNTFTSKSRRHWLPC